jgi:hypothetical protein
MDESATLHRRHLLGGVAGLAVTGTLAGCTGDDSGDNGADDSSDGAGSDGDGTDTPTGGEGEVPGAAQLDLREANVVGVEFEQRDGSYRFDVTLHHDDDGEDGYADWWQVERRDGSRLGRRDLLHAHSRQPFTRLETIDVPDDAGCVVVRGHDQTHGYGGVAMLVALDSGAKRAVEQGPDPGSFEAADCP